MKKLLIIRPSFYLPGSENGSEKRINKAKGSPVIGLTLPYLAALTPKDWQVELVDESIADVDLDARADVVAISSWTINAFRAYDLSARFRARGIPVIMGGPHTFFHTEEALKHCDAVCVGEAEYVWEEILDDALSAGLRSVYRASQQHPLTGLPLPRYELLKLTRWRFLRTYTVQTSRGCPFKCEFCSERFFVGERYRQRPADEVVAEIAAIGAKNLLLADSTFAGKRQRAMELMEKMIPLKVRWSTLWNAYLCLDDEFMDLAKRSGVLHVNIGMESINAETLSNMNKSFNDVSHYPAMIDGLRRRGISFSLNFVFGFDGERTDIFDSTLQFLRRYKVPVAYFNILDPQVGTPLYERFKAENRLLDEERMRHETGNVCKIKPSYCSAEELEDRVLRMYEEFYAIPSMIRRLSPPITKPNIASWILNFSQRRISRADRNVENFDWT